MYTRHLHTSTNYTYTYNYHCCTKRQPGKGAKEQYRHPHPECRWKDVSCVKYLLTKKAYDQKRLEKAIRHSKTSSCGNGSSSVNGNGGGGSSSNGSSSGTGYGAGGDEDVEVMEVEVMEVERTELELATEAVVVRAKGTGRQARKELRQSMTRYCRLQRSSTVQCSSSPCSTVRYGTVRGQLLQA